MQESIFSVFTTDMEMLVSKRKSVLVLCRAGHVGTMMADC